MPNPFKDFLLILTKYTSSPCYCPNKKYQKSTLVNAQDVFCYMWLQNWSFLIALIARPAPNCPKETGGRRNFGPRRWSFPAVGFCLSELCPSLCELCHCPTLWTSLCHWCSRRPPWSEWDTLKGARRKMLSGPWFQTVPYNQTYGDENHLNFN